MIRPHSVIDVRENVCYGEWSRLESRAATMHAGVSDEQPRVIRNPISPFAQDIKDESPPFRLFLSRSFIHA